MMKVTAPANRDVHLASTSGATVNIPRGTSRTGQPYMAADAAAQGCSVQPIDAKDADKVPQADDDDKRKQALEDAVKAAIAEGHPDDFTSTGRPKKGPIKTRAGVDFTMEELEVVYDTLIAQG